MKNSSEAAMKFPFFILTLLTLLYGCGKKTPTPKKIAPTTFSLRKFNINVSKYNYEKMILFTKTLRELKEIPTYPEIKTEIILVSEEKIPAWLEAYSDEIQLFIFGRKLIDVVFCDSSAGVMSALFDKKTICISVSEFNDTLLSPIYKNPRLLLRFFLTHEISHFIHEISTHISGNEDQSLNGSISTYRNDFDWYVKKIIGNNNYETMTLEQLDSLPMLAQDYAIPASFMHAEVDTYAYLIFKNKNIEIPTTDLLILFSKWLKESKNRPVEKTDADAQARLDNLMFFL